MRAVSLGPEQLAIGASILVVGIGGAAFPGGNIPIWGWQLPSIATSAVVGILINLIFLIFPPERYVPAARMAEMRASKQHRHSSVRQSAAGRHVCVAERPLLGRPP